MELHKVFRLNIPAVRRYQGEHKVLHFIGKDKPWHCVDGISRDARGPKPLSSLLRRIGWSMVGGSTVPG